MSRRSLLAGGAVLAGALAAGYWRRSRVPDHGLEKISAAEAHRRAAAGEILLVDIRTPREWRRTGLGTSAVPIDMRRQDFLDALAAAGGGTGRPVALICARGGRSARMALRLQQAGYAQIIDVAEGMLGSGAGPGWIAAGLPVAAWDG